ncbi:hypothetical protein PspLS_02677 [Pyricularia sp. CBS 133598]|nr:hypothetical protein PspLS_02677 [Pyricularia sp. CBS 133598]
MEELAPCVRLKARTATVSSEISSATGFRTHPNPEVLPDPDLDPDPDTQSFGSCDPDPDPELPLMTLVIRVFFEGGWLV